MPVVTVAPRFKRRFEGKTPQMQAAITRAIKRLEEDPRYPGLRVHRVQGEDGVWEAYIDRSSRMTFHYGEDGRIVLRNNCNHDILLRSP